MSSTCRDRWTETRDTLSELIEWLEDARQWAESVATREPVDDETREASRAFQAAEPAEHIAANRPPLDLRHVVAELTALRHDVKLQARSARQDRELAGTTVEQLSQALAELERWRSNEPARRDAAITEAREGAAELLVDLHDALSRSSVEAGRVARTMTASLQSLRRRSAAGSARRQETASQFPGMVLHKIRTALARFRRPRRAADSVGGDVPASMPSNVSSLDTGGAPANSEGVPEELAAISQQLEGITGGYVLALRRIERALAEFEIESIEALGHAVDPTSMEVVQSICDADRPPGTVVAEVRRGYRRRGQIMRFAQVVVNRTSA